jgi:hypothetical protein
MASCKPLVDISFRSASRDTYGSPIRSSFAVLTLGLQMIYGEQVPQQELDRLVVLIPAWQPEERLAVLAAT